METIHEDTTDEVRRIVAKLCAAKKDHERRLTTLTGELQATASVIDQVARALRSEEVAMALSITKTLSQEVEVLRGDVRRAMGRAEESQDQCAQVAALGQDVVDQISGALRQFKTTHGLYDSKLAGMKAEICTLSTQCAHTEAVAAGVVSLFSDLRGDMTELQQRKNSGAQELALKPAAPEAAAQPLSLQPAADARATAPSGAGVALEAARASQVRRDPSLLSLPTGLRVTGSLGPRSALSPLRNAKSSPLLRRRSISVDGSGHAAADLCKAMALDAQPGCGPTPGPRRLASSPKVCGLPFDGGVVPRPQGVAGLGG